jgi:hypothetical protein
VTKKFQHLRGRKFLALARCGQRAYPPSVCSEQKARPPGGLRQNWPLAALLLSHRAPAAMLLRRALPEANSGAAQVSKFLYHSTGARCREIKGAFERGPFFGRDSALRCPRRVQRRNMRCDRCLRRASFRPLVRGRGRRSAASLPFGTTKTFCRSRAASLRWSFARMQNLMFDWPNAAGRRPE